MAKIFELVIDLLKVQRKKLIEDIGEEVYRRMVDDKPEPRYYTRNEVAAAFHLSLVTLDKLVNNGTLKCKRIGRRVLFNADEIDAALEQKVNLKYRRV